MAGKDLESSNVSTSRVQPSREEQEVFGDDKNHQIQYRTLSWPFVAVIMTTKIVTGGTLTLPQALGVVGIVPGLIVLIFCGVFALFTAYLLIDFKLNHPEVHNMGDAGYIIFSPFKLGALGREIFSAGTLFFAVTCVGTFCLLGQLALSTLSNYAHCAMLYTGIFSIMILLCGLPRVLNWGLNWLSVVACISVLVSCIVAMVGVGLEPTPDRQISATQQQSFYNAFLAVTNPVLAYAGHFVFFPLISEMKQPQDAKKSATALQVFATVFYCIFAIVTYCYTGNDVQSPSFLSLSTVWAKAAWGLLLPNILVAGALNNHIAAKIVFVRLFRDSHHLHSHTILSWSVWILLNLISVAIGFVLALGVPFYSYLGGIAASLFAAWFTYGLAGAFWLHDTHHLGAAQAWKGGNIHSSGRKAVKSHKLMLPASVATLIIGAFICVAGMYAMVAGILNAYKTGEVITPFSC